jgi:hypothetical protein
MIAAMRAVFEVRDDGPPCDCPRLGQLSTQFERKGYETQTSEWK